LELVDIGVCGRSPVGSADENIKGATLMVSRIGERRALQNTIKIEAKLASLSHNGDVIVGIRCRNG
jgi:hypothetical protein